MSDETVQCLVIAPACWMVAVAAVHCRGSALAALALLAASAMLLGHEAVLERNYAQQALPSVVSGQVLLLSRDLLPEFLATCNDLSCCNANLFRPAGITGLDECLV